MNENQTNEQSYDEEIDLRELIMALWKQKIIIISITLILTILAGIFSEFIMSPVYDTHLNIVMSMPDTYTTKYGEYKLPITTNQQYINLLKSYDVLNNTIKDMEYTKKVTVKKLKEAITIGDVSTVAGVIQNNFEVKVSASNPKESLKLANCLYENYVEYLDVMIRERAVNFSYDDLSVKMKSAENLVNTTNQIINKNRKLLASTPQVIDQQEALLNAQNGTSNYIVIGDVVNPAYEEIQKAIIASEQIVITNESSVEEYTNSLKELDAQKAAIAKYHETGDMKELSTNSVVKTSIFLSSTPVVPTDKTSPSTLMNVIIGGVLGGMVGVIIVISRAYWKKEI